MRFAPEGLATIIIAGLFFIAATTSWFFGKNQLLGYLSLACLIVALFMLFFFRDPPRQGNYLPGQVISPADGTVVLIKETDEGFYLKGKALQVSIFLSVFNVHINRIPLSGRVAFKKYCPGKFLPAFNDKASLDNEQMMLGIETPEGNVLMKQIAGILARRVVCYPEVGTMVKTGERMGLIKFGSRVDLLLPPGTGLKVKIGDKVQGGVTVIGEMNKNN